MKRGKYLKFMSLIISLGLFLTLGFPAYAAEETGSDKAIIFLLDTSGSMKTNDPNRLAADSIAQLIYALPTDYKVGFVAYSGEITAEQEPVENIYRSKIMDAADGVEYKGYSNAGAGLQHAVDFLIKNGAQEKYIVMLSDGEILMKDDSDTQESLGLYQTVIQQAKEEGITIHVIGLGDEMEDMDNTIFAAAEETGGKSYYTLQAQKIQDAIDSILKEELEIKQSTVAIVDADGDLETVTVELPYAYADKLRVLLTGDAPIRNLNANFQAESAVQINGERYSLIEIKNPSGSRLELSFESLPESQVRVNVIPEYCVIPKVEILYTDRMPEISIQTAGQEEGVQSVLFYDRTAQINYTFYRQDNPNIQLWNTEYFEHDKIAVTIEGERTQLALNAGKLEMEQKVPTSCEYEVGFDYSELPVNVIGTESVLVELEEPPIVPAPEPEPPYLLIGAVTGGAILFAAAAALIVLYLRRPKPEPMPMEDRPEPSKYSYTGKLNLYITRTQSGYDIPPLSYNLFRLPAGKVISLQEILDDCDVRERFPGADLIYFKAGANRNLILTNNSDCTIMKNREILMKKKSYQLFLESKVDIAFEDEISEMTFQYKDLKPSEMW